MKTSLVIVLTAVTIAACSTSDKPKSTYNKVYEPERGVVCDRVEEACYDANGPTVAAAEKYLGPEAAQKFQRYVDRKGAANIRSIEFSDGVTCSYRSKLCRKARFPDQVAPNHTKALFGEY